MTGNTRSNFPPLPPYTHVPGVTPHPISDSKGHSYNSDGLPADWPDELCLKWGQHLFENGYYWEAHEAWEHLWIKLGRHGPEADTIKGLIKLAACGVKCLEANQAGAQRHAKRALDLLSSECELTLTAAEEIEAFRKLAEQAVKSPSVAAHTSDGTPRILGCFSPALQAKAQD